MAQSASSTLQTLATASSRKLYYKLEIGWQSSMSATDFDNVDWYDESAYVLDMRGDMQSVGWQRGLGALGSGVSNVVYVTLDNSTDRFSFADADSGLAAYLASDGHNVHMKRARVTLGFYDGATPHGLTQLTGYLVEAQENDDRSTVNLELRDRAAMAEHERAATALYSDQAAGDYIQTLAGMLDIDPLGTGTDDPHGIDETGAPSTDAIVYDPGMMPIAYAWMDDEPIWDEMGLVAESQLGRVYFSKDGQLRFEDGTHWVNRRGYSYLDPLTSQFTFSDDDYRAVNVRWARDSVYNHIVCEYWGRYISVEQPIYEASETYMVYPSDSRTVRAGFRYPVNDVLDPVADTDYRAVSAGGINMNSDLTITLANYAHHSDITLANANANYAMYMTVLQLRGHPVLPYPPSRYETEDSNSIARFGRRTWKISNPYIQSYRHAELVGNFLKARFKDSLQYVRLVGCRGIPWLEVGDRVTVVSDNLQFETGEDYFIVRIAWTFAGDRGYTMDLDLIRARDVFAWADYFKIGTSTYGQWSSVHGRVFW